MRLFQLLYDLPPRLSDSNGRELIGAHIFHIRKLVISDHKPFVQPPKGSQLFITPFWGH